MAQLRLRLVGLAGCGLGKDAFHPTREDHFVKQNKPPAAKYLADMRTYMERSQIGAAPDPFMWKHWDSKAFKASNRSLAKAPDKRIETALAAHDRLQAISTEIRGAAGLEPLPEGEAVQAWRGRLALLESKPKAKPRKAAKCKAELSPSDWVAEIARRRRQLERERLAIDAEIAGACLCEVGSGLAHRGGAGHLAPARVPARRIGSASKRAGGASSLGTGAFRAFWAW